MIERENNPDFLNSFLDYSLTILNKSTATVKEYSYDITNFLKFVRYSNSSKTLDDFKEISLKNMTIKELDKITLEDIHAYLAHLTTKFRSKPTTRARKASSLRVFFTYLYKKEKIISNNPAQDLETPKIGKRIPKYLTLEESKHLLATTQKDTSDRNSIRDYAIITLFLNCGIRLSELININIKDISFDDCKLNVIGKGNKERTIYLNKACLNAINDYLSIRPSEGIRNNSRDALFLSERKERISNRTVQNIVKKELLKAGLDTNKYSVHKLRHTAATLMYKYGNVDIRALQELLGHESISTTEIYTHVDNEQVRNAVESNPLSEL